MNPFKKVRLFWTEMIGELKKASWPSWTELNKSSFVVIGGMLALGAYIAVVDFSVMQIVEMFTDVIKGKFSN